MKAQTPARALLPALLGLGLILSGCEEPRPAPQDGQVRKMRRILAEVDQNMRVLEAAVSAYAQAVGEAGRLAQSRAGDGGERLADRSTR